MYFMAPTPLAAWLAAFFCKVFGTHVLSIKIYAAFLQAFLCSLSGLLILKVTKNLPVALLISAAVYIYGYGNLDSGPIYSPLASVFLLGVLLVVLPRQSVETLCNKPNSVLKDISIGVFLSLCILSKQNVGLAALGAWVAGYVYLWVRYGFLSNRIMGRPGIVLLLVLCFTTTVMAVALSHGAYEKFVEYAYNNKTAYLRYGKISYLEEWLKLFSRADWSNPLVLKDRFLRLQYFFPWLSVLFLGSAAVFRKDTWRDISVITLLFCGAAILGIFPRADLCHVSFFAAFSICGGVIGLTSLFPRMWNLRSAMLVGVMTVIWLAIGFLALLQPLLEYKEGTRVFSNIPAFYGSAIKKEELEADLRYAAAMQKTFRRDAVMIQYFLASYYYLASGLNNATPYDFPLKNVFGTQGENEIIDKIKRGEITAVCYSRVTGPLEPNILASYITSSMQEGRDLTICKEYRLNSRRR